MSTVIYVIHPSKLREQRNPEEVQCYVNRDFKIGNQEAVEIAKSLERFRHDVSSLRELVKQSDPNARDSWKANCCESIRQICMTSREIVSNAESLFLKGMLSPETQKSVLEEHESLLEGNGSPILSQQLLEALTGTVVSDSDLNSGKTLPQLWQFYRNLINRKRHVEEWLWIPEAAGTLRDPHGAYLNFVYWYIARRIHSSAMEFHHESERLSERVNEFHVRVLKYAADALDIVFEVKDRALQPFLDLGRAVRDEILKASQILRTCSDESTRLKIVQRLLEVAALCRVASRELFCRPSFSSNVDYSVDVLVFDSKDQSTDRRVVAHCLNLDLVVAGEDETEACESLSELIRAWVEYHNDFPSLLVAPARYHRAFDHCSKDAKLIELGGVFARVAKFPSDHGHPEDFCLLDLGTASSLGPVPETRRDTL